jgi:hypothetical protein
MDVLSYSAFSEAFQGRLAGRRVPLNGTIEVTRRCPLTASTATTTCRGRRRGARPRARLRRALPACSTSWLMPDVSGCSIPAGEIFARRDFLDIYTYAKKKGFIITLFTNGTMITERIADHLVAWRPFAIEITLYGLTKATYEQLTRHPGVVRQMYARHPPTARPGAAARAQDRRGLEPTGTRSRRCSASSRTSSASASSSIR